MVNAQEWLESQEEYNTKEKREKIIELDISGWNEKKEREKENWEKLTGSLVLSDFAALEKLNCSFNELTKLDCSNLVNLKELNCSNNNLTDLDIAGCYRLQKIDCSENNFVELEITNKYDLQELYCMNNKQLTSLNTTDSLLRKIDCSGCQIVSLSIYNNSYLTELNCSDNQLTSLTDFLEYAFADNFTFLNASNNKLADSDGSDNILETFANLTDLKTVDLSDNPLSISLKFFQHCGRLKELRIENTQITKGLEYLPESVKQIHCQGTKIADEELKNYFVEEEWGTDHYDYQDWRKDHWREVALAKYPLLKDEINELKQQLSEFREWKEKLVACVEIAPKGNN